MPLPSRKTHAMSHHRVSRPGCIYFLTITTTERKTDLTSHSLATQIKDVLRALYLAKDFTLHCGTIMPDHIHILGTLGERLSLSQVISKFKVVTKDTLQRANLAWHRNYYDHRLRHKVNTNSFARYIFLNPYRRKLLSNQETWPHWILNKNYKPEFLQQLDNDNLPPLEWIDKAPSLPDVIQSDTP